MSHPPSRSLAEVAAAGARLTALGVCCGHPLAAHAPDGSCRVCQLQGRRGPLEHECTGWRPADPWADDDVIDAEIESSGDPLTDAIHDVLARHYPADLDGRWVTCRDELIDAARDWAASALGIQR